MKRQLQHAPQAGQAAAEKGIIAPKAELLAQGSYIYRFASSDAPLGFHAGGVVDSGSRFSGDH